MQQLLGSPASAGTPRLTVAGVALLVFLFASGWWHLTRDNGSAPSGSTLQVEGDICIVAPPVPYDRSTGLSLYAPRTAPPDARCPVCGMYPSRFPDWAAQVIFDNGDAQFFDSPLSLFMYLQNPGRYSPGRSADQIAVRYVTDGTSRQWIDATKAWFVHGSTAVGPMRAGNFPAFHSKTDAVQFAQRRGGSVLAFDAIDDSVLSPLAGKGGHQLHSRVSDAAR